MLWQIIRTLYSGQTKRLYRSREIRRTGRYVKRGSKGIMVAGSKGARDKSKLFKLWEYSDENEIPR